MTQATLDRLSQRALDDFTRWIPGYALGLEAVGLQNDAETIFASVKKRLPEVLSQMPDPGFFAPTMRAFSLGGAAYITVFLVLRERGLNEQQVWNVCEIATRKYFESLQGLERRAASEGMFSLPMQWLAKSADRRSAAEPLGDWSVRFVKGTNGDFAYGVDYQACAIRSLAERVGAGSFAPYICLADAIGSDVLGWGLERTETLAQGGKRCDFRFRKGGETKVAVHLPVVAERKT